MLHYFDRASMAHSLEVRVPFLDHHLVEYCATIPDDLKVRGGETKYVLKRAARGVVPEFLLAKPKIGFFNRAVGTWFAAQANSAIAEYLQGESRYEAVLDGSTVDGLVAEHVAGDRTHSNLLLSVLMLEVWLRTFLPRAATGKTPSSLGARQRLSSGRVDPARSQLGRGAEERNAKPSEDVHDERDLNEREGVVREHPDRVRRQ